MPKVHFYPNMGSVMAGKPTIIAAPKVKVEPGNLRGAPLWQRWSCFMDSTKKKPRYESMVVCFDPPAGIKIENPFPPEIFNPGRTILLAGTISAEVAKVVCEQLMIKAEQDNKTPIILWIDSPGGDVEAGLLIKQVIETIKPSVSTVAIGGVSSMAALLSSFGQKGSRFAFEGTNLMYHEVRFGKSFRAPSEEMVDAGWDLKHWTDHLFMLLAQASGNSFEALQKSLTGVDKYFDSKSATRAGFIDWVIQHRRYRGHARPWGLRLKSYKSLPQSGDEKVVNLAEKKETSGDPSVIALRGFLDAMTSYKILARMLSQIALDPQRDLQFNIFSSPGGLIDEGMGIFDIMRLINVLPNCGSVKTFGKGMIEGISALLLAGGKYGERTIHKRGKVAIKDVEEVSGAYAPASTVLSIGREARRVKNRVVDRCDKHSKLSRPAIEEKIEKGFQMDALTAVEHEFVDRIR